MKDEETSATYCRIQVFLIYWKMAKHKKNSMSNILSFS